LKKVQVFLEQRGTNFNEFQWIFNEFQ